jgi:hypothetical protein
VGGKPGNRVDILAVLARFDVLVEPRQHGTLEAIAGGSPWLEIIFYQAPNLGDPDAGWPTPFQPYTILGYHCKKSGKYI